jgi:predicted KAP-like P-loop ATPase
VSKKPRTTENELEPLVLLEDEPVENWEQDELGLLDFSRIIAAAALGTRGPFTIGIYGAWGEGKTSVLKQAQTLLDRESGKRDNIVTVWFNAWQFEHEEHPIVPLVASIVDQIEKTLDERKSLAQTDREAVGTAFRKMRDALRSIAYGFSYAGFTAKDMIDRYEQLRKSGHPVLDRSLYYNAYEVLASAIPSELRKGDIDKMPRIVVFIDDLDRCLPDKAVRLLESIKLVLTQPGFIFALAVYKPVIQAYINAETNRQLEGINIAHRGVEYLDKIIQLALRVRR